MAIKTLFQLPFIGQTIGSHASKRKKVYTLLITFSWNRCSSSPHYVQPDITLSTPTSFLKNKLKRHSNQFSFGKSPIKIFIELAIVCF